MGFACFNCRKRSHKTARLVIIETKNRCVNMSLINVAKLSFSYENSYDMIFKNVSFQIDTDWKLGFIGRNGKGKTTFLKLLQGKYEYSGTIGSSVDFEYFPYEVKDSGISTINIIKGICPGCREWEIYRELSLLEVEEDVILRPFQTLSNGERTKVLLAALFLKPNSFLLIDEPTNHLDERAREVVGAYLKQKNGFIMVSHDRTLLDSCVDHILSINRENIEIQKGNFSSWWENKRAQDKLEQQQNQRLKKDINRLDIASKRNTNWSGKVEKTKRGTRNSGLRPDTGFIGHRSAKMMKRSKTLEMRRDKAIADKSKLLRNIDKADKLSLSPLHYHSPRLVELRDISLYYTDKTVCEKVNLIINRGDRIALRGRNGCGKSSIIKLICGEPDGGLKYSGDFYCANRLSISYVTQDTCNLSGSLSDYARQYCIDESLFKAILRKLDFQRVQFEKDICDFSDGQKKKVLLARSLCEQAHLYVWDEPLNFVDVLSRIQIEDLLLEYAPTLLFVEHDAAFIKNISTKTVEL